MTSIEQAPVSLEPVGGVLRPQGAGGAVAVRVERSGNAVGGGAAPGACHIPHILPQASDSVADAMQFGAKFPTKTMVSSAAGLLKRLPHWDGSEETANRYYLRVSPGSVQLLRRDEAAHNRSMVDAQESQIKAIDLGVGESEWTLKKAQEAGKDVLPETGFQEGWEFISSRTATRDIITEWSPQSRVNMIRTLSQLDYAPLFDGGGIPAMVTLTLPGDWKTVAPTAKAYQLLVMKFRKRWEREWGTMHAVWKREFQRRGAPHTHFFVTVPMTLASDKRSFKTWLSETWAAVVAHPDKDEYKKHLLAGTGVDYSEGMKAADPQRLAVYFSKHGSANSGGVKEYQNSAPAEWEGQSVGRFWGVWHLEKATATVALDYKEWITASRIMRRHHRAKGLVRKYQEWAVKNIDQATGEVEYELHERQSRSRRRFVQGSGFVTANDGTVFASQIAKYLDRKAGRTTSEPPMSAVFPHWPSGFRSPAPSSVGT